MYTAMDLKNKSIKNISQQSDRSTSSLREDLTRVNSETFITRCKSLVSLKNRKTKLKFGSEKLFAFTVLEQYPMDK